MEGIKKHTVFCRIADGAVKKIEDLEIIQRELLLLR